MRFYLDEHYSSVIAEICRRDDVDVQSTHEARRNGATDDLQLLFGAESGRAVVTENWAHFERLTRQFEAQGLPHAGVILVPPSLPKHDFAAIARAIIHFNKLYPDGLPPYAVVFLTRAPEDDDPR
jgi:hypothetical protein